MATINKLLKFFTLDSKTMLLFAEACLYLGWGRILISVPFAKVAPALGVQMEETSSTARDSEKAELLKVHEAIRIMGEHTWWESLCLVRAIAALKMLERRRIESTLYLGTARDETGAMVAHAWLRSGPYYITGAEGMERFTVVGKFANYAKKK